MKKLVLAFSLGTLLSTSAVFADTTSSTSEAINSTTAATVSDQSKPVVLNVPAHKTRKRLLFSFGLFGMGFRMGWMKPKGSENPELADQVHGVGYPILNVSAGHHAFGLGTK